MVFVSILGSTNPLKLNQAVDWAFGRKLTASNTTQLEILQEHKRLDSLTFCSARMFIDWHALKLGVPMVPQN